MAQAYADPSYPASGDTDTFDIARVKREVNAMQQMDFRPLRPRAHAEATMALSIEGAVVESFYSDGYSGPNRVTRGSGGTPLMTAPSSQDRIDAVFVNATGDFGFAVGAEAASPIIPTIPSSSGDVLPVCHIYHKVGETSIVNYEDRLANPAQGYILRDVRPILSIPAVLLDEDDMASNSDLKGATQQSIKAYIDAAQTSTHVLPEQSSAPATTAGQGALYTKEANSKTELFYREESNGDEVQITSGDLLEWPTWSLWGSTSDVTHSSGVITALASMQLVSASPDVDFDLDTINGVPEGAIISIRKGSQADITVKHGTGNLRLSGGSDYTTINSHDHITFVRSSGDSNLRELSRSINN